MIDQQTKNLLKAIKQANGRLFIQDGDLILRDVTLHGPALELMKKSKQSIIELIKKNRGARASAPTLLSSNKAHDEMCACCSKDQAEEIKDFTQLHLHSQMSLIDGFANTNQIAERAKELGQKAVALTNHGNMVDFVDFIESCEKRGVKPLVGNEVYFTPDRFMKKGSRRYHLILIAMNDVGLKNLITITTKAYLEGFYTYPRCDWELLELYNEGIICTAACIGGMPQKQIAEGELGLAKQTIQKFKRIFGDRYYLEIQPNNIPEQRTVNHQFAEWSKELDIPLVATMDSHYLDKKDYEEHKLFTKLKVQEKQDVFNDYRDNYWTSGSEVVQKLVRQTGIPYNIAVDAAKNTGKVAERVQQYNLDTSVKLPHFPLGKYSSEKEFLIDLCHKGWKERGLHLKEDQGPYEERLQTELDVICGKKFEGYFLIVKDMIDWVKSQDIPMGWGRGSAAGSLVAWLLGVSDLDPIEYDLLFERFLNPERDSLPDIDIDFSRARRKEVIQYLRDKYGHDHVLPIMTLGKIKAASAMKDAARAVGASVAEADQVAKILKKVKLTMDDEKDIGAAPILEALAQDDEAKKILNKYPRWVDQAIRISGIIRSFGTHASAIIIADRPIREILPVFKIKEKETIMADMNVCEKMGLVKWDILGLRTLDVLDRSVKMIKENHGEEVVLEKIPYEDAGVYQMLANGDTAGVFQLEKQSPRGLLRDIRTSNFNDIIDVNALNRPAPLTTRGEDGLTIAERYVKVKRGELPAEYLHPDLEPILGKTSGQLIFQEQMMIASGDFGGFSLGHRSELQRALSKKKEEKVLEYKEKFIQGSINNGYKESVVNEIWQWIEKGSKYLFNKSHSASYAQIAYRSAYLKHHYPLEFIASFLTEHKDSNDATKEKFADVFAQARRNGVQIVPPYINEAESNFAVVGDKIVWGFSLVKEVGNDASPQIIANRPYNSFQEFLKKNVHVGSKVTKKAIVALIKAGAFDHFGDRLDIMTQYQKTRPKKERETKSIFNEAELRNPTMTLYEAEKNVLRVSLTKHPLKNEVYGSTLTGGEVESFREILDKNGRKMAFVDIAAPMGIKKIVIFSSKYKECNKDLLKEKQWIMVEGKEDDSGSFLADKITSAPVIIG